MLARAAIELLSNEDRLRRTGQGARRRAVECFDTNRVVSQYESLYRRLLESGEEGDFAAP